MKPVLAAQTTGHPSNTKNARDSTALLGTRMIGVNHAIRRVNHAMDKVPNVNEG